MNKKTIILITVILFIFGVIYYFESTKVKPIAPELVENLPKGNAETVIETTESAQPLFKDDRWPLAPELTGLTGYINTKEGLQIKDFRGKVVLVDFWTYSCINCIRTLPHLAAWDTKYKDKGLVIIGVHTPEFEFEKKTENVVAAMEKYNIGYRVVQDNNYATWSAFKNRFWPRKYLIDADGYIRYDHIGEGAYEETEMKIQELLAEIDADVEDMGTTALPDETPQLPTTPELYAGYGFALNRGQNIGNEEGLQVDKTINYTLPEEIQPDVIYLQGLWQNNRDNLEAKEAGASIFLDYLAKNVNIVAMDGDSELEVFVDGSYLTPAMAGADIEFEGERAFIKINEPRLYNVIMGNYGRHTLKLRVSKPGFSFHAFTFG